MEIKTQHQRESCHRYLRSGRDYPEVPSTNTYKCSTEVPYEVIHLPDHRFIDWTLVHREGVLYNYDRL